MTATLTVPKRPANGDERIRPMVAERMVNDVMGWLKDGGDTSNREEILGQLTELIADAYDYDGFKLAKALADDGWDCDSRLVEILDNADHYEYEARDTLVKAWVVEQRTAGLFGTPGGLPDPLPVGRRVRFTEGHYEHRKELEGEIIEVDDARAQYTVCVESEGHIGNKRRDDKGKIVTGTIGSIVAWEKAVPADRGAGKEVAP